MNRTPQAVDIHVAGRLYALRRAADLTQTDLAKSVGLTFQQVQKYENGKNRMSAQRLWDFARVLDVPVTAFFEGLA